MKNTGLKTIDELPLKYQNMIRKVVDGRERGKGIKIYLKKGYKSSETGEPLVQENGIVQAVRHVKFRVVEVKANDRLPVKRSETNK